MMATRKTAHPTHAAVLLGMLAATLPALALAGTEGDLWRSGYRPIWESDYEDIEECLPDKPVKLSGNLYFECDGYEYLYHYGAVKIMGKEATYQGHKVTVTYLCLEGVDECLSGRVLRFR